MKKIMALLLMLSLMIPAFSTAENEARFTLPENADAAILSDGEKFYVQAEDSFYLWETDKAAPVLLMQGEKKAETESVYFFLYHQTFHQMDLKDGAVYALTEQAGNVHAEKLFSLDTAVFKTEVDWNDEEFAFKSFSDIQVTGDLLTGILTDEEHRELYTLNLKNGGSTCVPFAGEFLIPYQAGKLMTIMPDREPEAPNPFKSYFFAELNPQNGETKKIAEGIKEIPFRDIYGVCYDEKTDTLYILKQYQIYMLPHLTNPRLCAEIPNADMQWACIGETALLKSGNSLMLQKLSSDYKEKPPVILSETPGNFEAFKTSLIKAGGMKIQPMENGMTWDDISSGIISQSDQPDIYIVNSYEMDMRKVMEKGYCVSLQDSEKLSAFGESLYPYLQEGCMMNGTLYAVPVYSSALCDQVMDDWSEIEDISKIETLEELCDLVDRWEGDGWLEQYSDYIPSLMDRGNLMWCAYHLYKDYMLTTNQEMTLDTPLFREIMGFAEKVGDTSGWLDIINNEEELMWEKKRFVFEDEFHLYSPFHPHGRNVPLKLTKDTIPTVGFYVSYAFVNPYSKNADRAIQYLEYYVDSLGPVEKAEMCPACNEPIEDPKFQDNLAYMDWEIQRLESSVEKAENEESKQEYQKKLDAKRAEKEKFIAESRYIVTEEDLAFYRSLDEGFFLRTVNPVDNEDVDNVFIRYTKGQLDLEQFIWEADNKIKLIVMENQ